MHAPLLPATRAEWRMDDGCVLRGLVWNAGAAGAPIIYLHGIQSHGGWFGWSASLLAAGGRVVALVDRRGSGASDGPRGHVAAGERWMADLEAVSGQLAGPERVDLVGVSWGGKLAIEFARRHASRTGRVLLIAPGIYPRVDVTLAVKLRIAAALAVAPERRFAIPLSDPAFFTDNPAGRSFIAADPHKLTHASARFLFESARFDRRVRRMPHGAVRSRVTLLLAERERIIDNGRTETWLRRVTAENCAIATLGGCHTLEFEAEQGELRGELEKWRDESQAIAGTR